MGLVPPTAKPGDVIVRFWNCDAAIVMRSLKSPSGVRSVPPSFLLVGRADVAEVANRKSTGRDLHAEQCLSGLPAPGLKEHLQDTGPVYVELSLRVLQVITSNIAT